MSCLAGLALAIAAAFALPAKAETHADAEPRAERLDRIHVSARLPRKAAAEAVAASRIDAGEIASIQPQHAQEVLARIPGAWASRGSGQEQLLAIRSPVLAGTGACGAFLVLEQGIPIRPAGFCNVNQLFELPLELAGAVEVLRGPGTAVHGSNALHGVIDLRVPALDERVRAVAVEAGQFDWTRLRASLGSGDVERPLRMDFAATEAGSFREDEGFSQQRLLLQRGWRGLPGAPELLFSAQVFDQDTAGYITGNRAYATPARRSNPNPEAFRRAHSARLSLRSRFDAAAGELAVTPYARSDRMEFIQHFLLGKPLEENGSDSLGLQLLWSDPVGDLRIGMDFEHARGSLLQAQPEALTTGTPAQNAIRPAGRHYDYRVRSDSAAAFVQHEWAFSPAWSLASGARLETLGYRYDNRMADGNLSDAGLACAFGGCLYQRPADRSDRFTRPGLNLGLQRLDARGGRLFLRAASAWRAPQAGELYRLQRGQSVAELGPERADSIELGYALPLPGGLLQASAYRMDKRGSIFRDAAGFNVGDGRSRHRGIEAELELALPVALELSANLAWSEQVYRFDRALGGGETIRRGNRVDTAPEWLGGLRLGREFGALGRFELEWQHQGGYFADAGNTFFHPGHDLVNLRWNRALAPGWSVSARLGNLGDIRYAERADFGFGERRYFPGAPRALVLGLSWRG